MDAALRFRFRHALDAVHPAFKFQARVGPFAFNHKANLFEAAKLGFVCAEDFGLPALCLGVHGIHAQEGACKQSRLLPARAAADFYDHVFFVVRVARKQQNFQLLLRALHFSACLLQLFKHHIVELFIEPARVEQSFRLLKCIARRLELAVFFNDRGQALRLLHEFFILRLIGDDLRVAQPKLNLFIARFNLF